MVNYHLDLIFISFEIPLIVYLLSSMAQIHSWKMSGSEKFKFFFIIVVGSGIGIYSLLKSSIEVYHYIN